MEDLVYQSHQITDDYETASDCDSVASSLSSNSSNYSFFSTDSWDSLTRNEKGRKPRQGNLSSLKYNGGETARGRSSTKGVKFSYAPACEHPGCSTSFFISGRHHCRKCGISICSVHSCQDVKSDKRTWSRLCVGCNDDLCSGGELRGVAAPLKKKSSFSFYDFGKPSKSTTNTMCTAACLLVAQGGGNQKISSTIQQQHKIPAKLVQPKGTFAFKEAADTRASAGVSSRDRQKGIYNKENVVINISHSKNMCTGLDKERSETRELTERHDAIQAVTSVTDHGDSEAGEEIQEPSLSCIQPAEHRNENKVPVAFTSEDLLMASDVQDIVEACLEDDLDSQQALTVLTVNAPALEDHRLGKGSRDPAACELDMNASAHNNDEQLLSAAPAAVDNDAREKSHNTAAAAALETSIVQQKHAISDSALEAKNDQETGDASMSIADYIAVGAGVVGAAAIGATLFSAAVTATATVAAVSTAAAVTGVAASTAGSSVSSAVGYAAVAATAGAAFVASSESSPSSGDNDNGEAAAAAAKEGEILFTTVKTREADDKGRVSHEAKLDAADNSPKRITGLQDFTCMSSGYPYSYGVVTEFRCIGGQYSPRDNSCSNHSACCSLISDENEPSTNNSHDRAIRKESGNKIAMILSAGIVGIVLIVLFRAKGQQI